MSQFNRKADSGGTPASGSQEPDFSALEAPTGFTAGQVERPATWKNPIAWNAQQRCDFPTGATARASSTRTLAERFVRSH